MMSTVTTVRLAASLEDLLVGAVQREPYKTADSRSGCRFERVLIDGERYLVKYMSVDDDWIMRATGDVGLRERQLWSSYIVSRLPAVIDHTVVGMAPYRAVNGRAGLALLMRDVAPWFVSEGSSILPDETHLRFLDHMAELHATFWGWRDDIGLFPFTSTYCLLTPVMSAIEEERGGDAPVPPAVAAGWARFRSAAPRAADLVLGLLTEPGPLLEALLATPQTFIQGDWKLGNLGSHPDGRTILVDWDRAGEGPPCTELAWYLAVNCDRLEIAKESAIESYRRSLESRGVSTQAWWEEQLGLALLGALVFLGWSKTNGNPPEIGWWEERALDAIRYLA
jgi:hypothetical protein